MNYLDSTTPLILYGIDSKQFLPYLQTHHLASHPFIIKIKLITGHKEIKIDQIRQLKKQLATTLSQPRLVWIQQAHLLNHQAQNALLKTLEEPPKNTTFILTTTRLQKLLPTIISRCHLHYLNQNTQTIDQSILQTLKSFLSQSPGERLADLSQLPTKRTEALTWLNQLLISLNLARQQTTNLHQLQIFKKIIQPTLEAKQALEANLNPTLALEHFLLSLPRSTDNG